MENKPDKEGSIPSRNPDQAPKIQDLVGILSQHDIPPPIMISEGSLTIEIDDELTVPQAVTPGPTPRWVYKKAGGAGIATGIGHIRILDGNGEMAYEELNPAEATVITIQLDNDGHGTKTGDIVITGGPTEFSIASSTKLDPRVDHGPHGQSKKHRQYQHKHPEPQAGGRPFRIMSIKVEDADGVRKRIVARDEDPAARRKFFSEEYRLLIWLHPPH